MTRTYSTAMTSARMPTISLATVSNDSTVLQSNLLASPALSEVDDLPVFVKTGYSSAAPAYNRVIEEANTDVIVFAHQDIYLPRGWLRSLQLQIREIENDDPDWGVIGCYGIDSNRTAHGYVYCNGQQRLLGRPTSPYEVKTLDEIVLVIRKQGGLSFDEGLHGFHHYATDISLQAQALGMRSYAVANCCIHNTIKVRRFPKAFREGLLYMRRKWWSLLPIFTPSVSIYRSIPHMFWIDLKRNAWMLTQPYSSRRMSAPELVDLEARLCGEYE